MKVNFREALDLLSPRYTPSRASWKIDGIRMQFNSQMTPKKVDALIKKIIARYDRAGLKPAVKWMPTNATNMWFLQRTCVFSTIEYLMKRGWSWQRWPKARLGIYVIRGGKIIVWNGTHRTILCRLAHKRMRVRVIDLDAFAAWVKKHPDESKWNVRVVKFKPKKGKRRGR